MTIVVESDSTPNEKTARPRTRRSDTRPFGLDINQTTPPRYLCIYYVVLITHYYRVLSQVSARFGSRQAYKKFLHCDWSLLLSLEVVPLT